MMNTEDIPNKEDWIDQMSIEDALITMLNNQSESILAVKKAIPNIKQACEMIFNRLLKTDLGRIIYVGCGTSGRIGVQDGVELYPTFGWSKKRMDYIIAGGEKAITTSIENAEDDKISADKEVLKKKISNQDVIIALAASGKTTFTLEVMKKSRAKGALVIGVANNFSNAFQKYSDVLITLLTGTEIIGGSTRLKAGTAQKICLNMLSTMLMTKFGRVRDGKMIYMIPTNKKLRNRQKTFNL